MFHSCIYSTIKINHNLKVIAFLKGKGDCHSFINKTDIGLQRSTKQVFCSRGGINT